VGQPIALGGQNPFVCSQPVSQNELVELESQWQRMPATHRKTIETDWDILGYVDLGGSVAGAGFSAQEGLTRARLEALRPPPVQAQVQFRVVVERTERWVLEVRRVVAIFVVNPVFDPDWRRRAWGETFERGRPFFAAHRAVYYTGAVFSKWLQQRTLRNTDYDFRGRVSWPVYLLCAAIQVSMSYGGVSLVGLLVGQLLFPELIAGP
jgi:hypothetical protein